MGRVFLSSVFSLAFILSSQAQSAIEGRVANEKKEPIEYATVLLRKAQDSVLVMGTTTSESGGYVFKQVNPGRYLVSTQFIGYLTGTTLIEVADKSTYTLPTIILAEDARLLNEVVVQGQRPLLEQDDEKLTLNVQNTIIASGGSAIELLGRAPGVSVDQNDQITLNGKTGVTILIDGKMVYLPPAELAAMLRSMNANNVASVEIIANPTARYDAAGNSGIINIKLKKSAWEGFNGSATAGAGYGRYGKANVSTALNYRAGKWNHFLNYGHTLNRRFAIVDIDRTSVRDDGSVYFQQYSNRVQDFSASTWQAGSEYQWNTRNTLTLGTAGSVNSRTTGSETSTRILSDPNGEADSSLAVASWQEYGWYNVAATLGYKHLFAQAGHELTADVDYSRYGFSLDDNILVSEFRQDNSPESQYTVLTHQPSSFDIYAARADYVRPLGSQNSLEAGIKYSKVATASQVLYSNNQSGEFEPDLFRTNDFNYQEEISAAYLNLKTKVAGFNAQLGLRGEQTQYDGYSGKEDRRIERNYFKLFPSVSLSREFHANYRAGLSYSHRIDRPAYNDLYPFVYFLDPFSGQRGNPLLLPQLTHTFQLSQTLAKEYTINAGYSQVTRYMAYVITLLEDRVSGYASRSNLDNHQNFYLNVMAPVRIGKYWSMNANVNLFYNRFDTRLFGDNHTIEVLSGMANLSQTITLPWGVTGEVTAVYSAPNATGLFQNRAMGSLNAGLSKQFLDKKLAVRLNVTDIFKTNYLRSHIAYPGFDMNTMNRAETRIARVNVTYNFGKSTGKSARKRNAQEEEQRRINTN